MNLRINPEMTDQEAILVMAGNNPGAIIACAELLKYEEGASPEYGFGEGWNTLFLLDRLHIWDWKIAALWRCLWP